MEAFHNTTVMSHIALFNVFETCNTDTQNVVCKLTMTTASQQM